MTNAPDQHASFLLPDDVDKCVAARHPRANQSNGDGL